MPDLGGSDNVDVIEVCVAAGDEISEGDSIIVLETDKASMETQLKRPVPQASPLTKATKFLRAMLCVLSPLLAELLLLLLQHLLPPRRRRLQPQLLLLKSH